MWVNYSAWSFGIGLGLTADMYQLPGEVTLKNYNKKLQSNRTSLNWGYIQKLLRIITFILKLSFGHIYSVINKYVLFE